jgi:uncharacterized membrane protein YoaK (UPF0700 family)
MKIPSVAALLSFNGGFVDTAGFIGLQGLFTAHVTGNFVTLGAALVFGTHGVIAKLIALPEFIFVVAVTRAIILILSGRGYPVLRLLMVATVLFLLLFFILGVTLGPFADSDAPGALLTGFAGIAGMAIQNAVQRIYFANIPPTTIMTGNTTQIVIDAVDLIHGLDDAKEKGVRVRFGQLLRGIVWFAGGCAAAALLYHWSGFWCLAVPVLIGAAAAAACGGLGPRADARAGGSDAFRTE